MGTTSEKLPNLSINLSLMCLGPNIQHGTADIHQQHSRILNVIIRCN